MSVMQVVITDADSWANDDETHVVTFQHGRHYSTTVRLSDAALQQLVDAAYVRGIRP